MKVTPVSATRAWFDTLHDLLTRGTAVSPRGAKTVELLQETMVVDMMFPVVESSHRKVQSKFLGGEAYWILSGDDRVETIAPYNPRIAQFSDDGLRFFGAYGPRFVEQVGYVVDKLLDDPSSRQACLTLWRPNPPFDTKDVPCTIAMTFMIRSGELNAHVFMRSSDIWLGVPYDVFNFSMCAYLVCAMINNKKQFDLQRQAQVGLTENELLAPGALYLTAASRHLYAQNRDAAKLVLELDSPSITHGLPDAQLYRNPSVLLNQLDTIRHGIPSARWWKQRL